MHAAQFSGRLTIQDSFYKARQGRESRAEIDAVARKVESGHVATPKMPETVEISVFHGKRETGRFLDDLRPKQELLRVRVWNPDNGETHNKTLPREVKKQGWLPGRRKKIEEPFENWLMRGVNLAHRQIRHWNIPQFEPSRSRFLPAGPSNILTTTASIFPASHYPEDKD